MRTAAEIIDSIVEGNLEQRYQNLERTAQRKSTGAIVHNIANMLTIAAGHADFGDEKAFREVEKEILNYLHTRITPIRFRRSMKRGRPGRYGEGSGEE